MSKHLQEIQMTMTAKLLRFYLGLFIVVLFNTTLSATHNRAGEIIVELVTPDGDCVPSLTARATIITYTRTSSTNADRDTLTLCWGDGFCERVARSNGPGSPPQGEPLENDVKFNLYISTHAYTGFGQYTISFEDPNRNEGVVNVNFPNSVSVPFYVETVYSLVNPAFQGCNNSPVLQVPPIDIACLGEVFTHNPGAYDPDGDSLSYIFTTPRGANGAPVPEFDQPPNLTIDPSTGDLVWDTPDKLGEHNIAIMVISYRNGSPFDTLIRDMQIFVEDCINDPPTVVPEVEELCVIAGELIEFNVVAGAPITDIDQQVRLLGYGAAFNLEDSPAEMVPPSTAYFEDPLVKQFRWQTNCNHINNQPYNIVFRAVDNFLGDTIGLATLKTIKITIVGPPPEDVQAVPSNEEITISWKLPYDCEETNDDYFRGFSVWRRINSDQTPIDPCDPGLEGRGYTKITPAPINDVDAGRYFFVDTDIEQGRTYCYRILGEFARLTTSGFLYNSVESLPSDEVCVQLNRDVPLITNVDVLTTDAATGSMEICWSKPAIMDFDTLINPGPYVYELFRAPGQTEDLSTFTLIASLSSPDFANANDTCYTDTGLNTLDEPYTYYLNFLSDGDIVGPSNIASSIYLQTSPTDRTNILFLDEFVPWENYTYEVFRENTGGGFDLIATLSDPMYRDTGLINGENYCYYIRSEGTYNINNIKDPLFNRSQIACETPIDNVPPCPPILSVTNICDEGNFTCEDEQILFNTLSWQNPATICPEGADTKSYRVYYSPFAGSDFTLIDNIEGAENTLFEHQPTGGLAGCYAVTALDTLGNESEFSNIFCVDNCPIYELPNAFTPNGDGQNDFYTPISSCFIEQVEFQVFNRWGNLVFETTDPLLNWNGENLKGELLTEATYFYRCKVFERRVDGIFSTGELLSGYIELVVGN